MEVLFLTWFLVFVRAGAMLAIFPIFSAAAMPIRLRLAVAGFLALLSMPGVTVPPELASGDMIGAVGLVAQEVCYGLLLGGVVRLVLFSVGLAGHYIGTELGLQLSSLIAPGRNYAFIHALGDSPNDDGDVVVFIGHPFRVIDGLSAILWCTAHWRRHVEQCVV